MFKGIEFTHSGFFWLLLAIPFLIFWYALKHKQQNADLSVSSLDGLRGQSDIWGWLKHFLFVLRIGAIALIVIALARPQTVDISTKTKTTRGIDIVMAIDVSASMLAKDLKPSRLEALKNVASRFIKRRPNDRIGLVEYAGES
jgi:Ca-activated chloride channel family protein